VYCKVALSAEVNTPPLIAVVIAACDVAVIPVASAIRIPILNFNELQTFPSSGISSVIDSRSPKPRSVNFGIATFKRVSRSA
jgi:hypothetical protein